MTVSEGAFRHEALFYDGEDEFLSGTLPFVREAVAANEPVLIAVGEAKIRLLERHLGDRGRRPPRRHYADRPQPGAHHPAVARVRRRPLGRRPPGARDRRAVAGPQRSGADRVPAHRVAAERGVRGRAVAAPVPIRLRGALTGGARGRPADASADRGHHRQSTPICRRRRDQAIPRSTPEPSPVLTSSLSAPTR